MHQFPPGLTRKLVIGVGIAAMIIVLLAAVGLGGRPTPMDEAKRQVQREQDLWSKARGK